MSGPVREFKRESCPICGHKGWCGRRDDGLVLCKRPPTPREVLGFDFRGIAKDGATGMYVEAGRKSGNGRATGSTDARLASNAHGQVKSSTYMVEEAGEEEVGEVDPYRAQ